jgi:hypothetical protein
MLIQGVTLTGTYVVDHYDIVTDSLYANYGAATGVSGTTFNDVTGNGHNATLRNGATTTLYNNYPVLRLNAAASQYFVDTNSYNNDLNNAFTFDVWCYPLTGNSPGVLISEWDNSDLSTGGFNDDQMGFSNGTIQMGLYSTGYVTGPSWTLLNWYHIVMSYDGTGLTTYVNNTATGSTVGAKQNPGVTYLTMGAPANDFINIPNTPYFNGYIGAWKIYNRALSAAEVTQNYNALRTRYGV